MNEAEWLACTDPDRMLFYLRGKVSDRKLRLFAAACCRLIWPLLTDERSQRAVEIAERYADGRATPRERASAGKRALDAAPRRGGPAAWAAYWAVSRSAADTVWNVAAAATEAASRAAVGDARIGRADEVAAWDVGRAAGSREQAALLRDIVGNPFRPAAVERSWLAWNDGAVRKIAQTIYNEGRFGDLPLLADALEDAGCTDADVLTHCRTPGEHVRGCFAVDLLTGKP